NRNARAFGATPLEFTPGMAVGIFFVPILNLYKPYAVIKEVWQAGDTEGATPWQYTPVPLLLPLWWLAWLVESVAGMFVRLVSSDAHGAAGVITALHAQELCSVLTLLAAGLCIAVVQGLSV